MEVKETKASAKEEGESEMAALDVLPEEVEAAHEQTRVFAAFTVRAYPDDLPEELFSSALLDQVRLPSIKCARLFLISCLLAVADVP